MKIRILSCLGLLIVFVMPCSHANWLKDIFEIGLRMEGIQTDMFNSQGEMLGVEKDILSTQKDIDHLTQQVNSHLTGHSGWGTYQLHDYQSYGDSARDWSGVMRMAESGRGEGALGQTMGKLATQFPADSRAYNQGVSDTHSRQYYALKSQTVLAARAASQLDYNKIQDQIAYQQLLQKQIEKTNDLKAAVDLSSRIQVEGNLINLEILRQTALINQQQAITEQATVNTALSNARFLTKRQE